MIEALIRRVLALSPQVRYVAVYWDGVLQSREREGLSDATSSESDRYEELLVNPTLLKLATQRGNIDCGGLRFLIVGYGNFYQIVGALPRGHLSVAVELSADPIRVASQLQKVVEETMP
ncbi:MAG TPA: hypothetical protein VNK82_06270 [Terriglobales bacterium]|nr:hypothetical protein [Terriglobales bacterium]